MQQSFVGLGRMVEQVLAYLQLRAHEGTLTVPISEIAAAVGVSNSSIHRALKELESNGFIRIHIPKAAAKPATYEILRPLEPEDIKSRTRDLQQEFTDILEFWKKIQQVLDELMARLALYERHLAEWNHFQNRIISKSQLPDGSEIYVLRPEPGGKSEPAPAAEDE